MSEYFIPRDQAESDLLSAAAFIAERVEAGDDHAEAIQTVLPAYLARGEVDLAAELANTIDDPFSRGRLLAMVAAKCAELNDDEYARQLVDAIEEPGLRSDGLERLGMVKASLGQFEAAAAIADDMAHPEFVQAAIAVKQAATDVEAANDTIGAIAFPAARVSARCGIAQSLIAAETPESAAQLLTAAVDDAREIEHAEEKVRALIETGNLFLDAGRSDRAVETFDKARETAEEIDNIHRDGFLAMASVGFLRAGSQELADRALDLVRDKTQIANALLGHARHFWRDEKKDDAIESLDEAYDVLRSQKEIETRSSRERFGLFTSIATQFAGFEKGERAIEIAEKIEDDEQRMVALTQIAQIMTIQSRAESARFALNAIGDPGQTAIALIGMSDGAKRADDRDMALRLLREAAEQTESIPQHSVKAAALNEIADRAAALDADDILEMAVTELFATIGGMRSRLLQVNALSSLASVVEKHELELSETELGQVRSITNRAG